jgi:hypothetical protein
MLRPSEMDRSDGAAAAVQRRPGRARTGRAIGRPEWAGLPRRKFVEQIGSRSAENGRGAVEHVQSQWRVGIAL